MFAGRIAPAAGSGARDHAARGDRRHEHTEPERRHARALDAEQRQIWCGERHCDAEHQRRAGERQETRDTQKTRKARVLEHGATGSGKDDATKREACLRSRIDAALSDRMQRRCKARAARVKDWACYAQIMLTAHWIS